MAGGPCGGDAGENSETERPAHHERCVDEAGREAGVFGCYIAHRGHQHRIEGDPGADAEQQHARQHVGDEVSIDRRASEQQQANGRHRQPDNQGQPVAEPDDELGRDRHRADRHHDVARQEGQADVQRVVPQDQLQVERGQEEPREHRRGPENAHDVGGCECARTEDGEPHQRHHGPALDDDERREQRDGEAEQPERAQRRPAGLVAINHCFDGKQ